MIHYARADTHFLFEIYDKLKNELLDKSLDSIAAVLEYGRQVGVAPVI